MPTIGILKETIKPEDAKVALTPDQIIELQQQYPDSDFIVQPSNIRCFSNNDYLTKSIKVSDDLTRCDFLIGLNIIDTDAIIPNKNYLIFNSNFTKRTDNPKVFDGFIKQKATYIQLDKLTDEQNNRLISFGRWAGIEGAYNALRAFGLREDLFEIKPPSEYTTKDELFRELKKLVLPPIKILITGGGRVAGGVREVLAQLEIHKVSPSDFIKKEFEDPVFTLIEPVDYVKRLDNIKFDLQHFYQYPEEYKSAFQPYTKVTDILITSHYWNPRSPLFFTQEQMKLRSFNISVIADISCDLHGSIPTTIRYSSTDEPFYGVDKFQLNETKSFEENSITMMAINNLPSAFPRDASEEFGKKFAKKVLPLFLEKDENGIIKKGIVIKHGVLVSS